LRPETVRGKKQGARDETRGRGAKMSHADLLNRVQASPRARPALAPRPALPINPWIVAIAVVIPTFMEVLDTTIANVALRYIAGGLSAAVIDAEWVLTSYLAA